MPGSHGQGGSPNENEYSQNADYVARGIATEAVAALRSHESMDGLQFMQMANQHKEIKDLIANLKKELTEQVEAVKDEMHSGFSRYDNKFWSLAIATISLLMGITGLLLYRAIFGGHV